MVRRDATTPRRISYTVLLMLLFAATVAAGVMLGITTRAALQADNAAARKGILRFAYVSLALLGFCLLLLVWAVIRCVRLGSRPASRRPPTDYADAWALAGKRYRVKDGPEELREGLEGEGDDEGDEDRPE